jgi:hypothetical protein
MSSVPFKQRFGFDQLKPIDNDFPETAKIALAHLLVKFNQEKIVNKDDIYSELLRTSRFIGDSQKLGSQTSFFNIVIEIFRNMKWWQIYTICERIYDNNLRATGYNEYDNNWIEVLSSQDVKTLFTKEINNILAEESLAYDFYNGRFQRRGRAQTQINFQRVGSVLSNPLLVDIRNHYNKARRFFDVRPEPDKENCVKESLCALEACLETIIGKPASKDFEKVVRQLQGNDIKQIPSPTVEGIIKLHAYRGSGQGVAHAALQGNRVSILEAELVLNLVASYITYLVDLLLSQELDVPF